MALGALRSNKLRSSLTLLGTIIGVTAVIAVVSLVEGMNDYVSSRLLSEGSDVFSVDKIGFELDQDKIREQFIEPLPDNPDFDALLEPVLDWAAAEKPAELAALFPDERLERNRDTARRWRALLEEWRKTR